MRISDWSSDVCSSDLVERITQKHVGLQILPEHYPYVGEALLGAIKAVLGDAATDEILAAWGEAYWFLANILIAREDHLYRELASPEGGWNGWSTCRVDEVRAVERRVGKEGVSTGRWRWW